MPVQLGFWGAESEDDEETPPPLYWCCLMMEGGAHKEPAKEPCRFTFPCPLCRSLFFTSDRTRPTRHVLLHLPMNAPLNPKP